MTRRLLVAVALVLAVGVGLALGHLALIEVRREVVTLRTPHGEDGWKETRLWVVDHQGVPWLHSAGEDWLRRFEDDPVVELVRGGVTRRYRARAIPGPHPTIDRLLREKYGVADRWVRLLAPCGGDTVAVRLEPLEATRGHAGPHHAPGRKGP